MKATTFRGPVALIENCRFESEVIVSFTVKANGRTTKIVVETVRGSNGKRSDYCVSDYARSIVRGSQFPKRDQACHHVMTFHFADKT